MSAPNPFLIVPEDGEPVAVALARSVAAPRAVVYDVAQLTDVAQGDPYLAAQLQALRDDWEIRPPAATGLLARLRTRLAWWLLGPEIQQINQVHASLTRLADSLVVLVDHERDTVRQLIEYREPPNDDR